MIISSCRRVYVIEVKMVQIVQNGTNSANSANSFSRLNVIPMVTTKKIAREYTQKEMRRELKILPQKFNRKEDRNSGNDR